MTERRYIYAYLFTRRRIAESLGNLVTPEEAASILWPMFDGAESERLVVAFLDRKQQALGVEELYRGNVAGTSVRLSTGHTYGSGNCGDDYVRFDRLTTSMDKARRIAAILAEPEADS